MAKIASQSILSAIQTAMFHEVVSRELRHRDEDNRLDCIEVKCRVISAVDERREEYAMIFNYGDISDKERSGVDVNVKVSVVYGREMIVTEWKAAGK